MEGPGSWPRSVLLGTLAEMRLLVAGVVLAVVMRSSVMAAPTDYEQELLRREIRKRKAREHPAFLIQHLRAVDPKTKEEFNFDVLDDDECAEIDIEPRDGRWRFHRDVLEGWMSNALNLEYKARQIGVTWLAAGLALWTALYRPHSRVLIVSINEDEAKKVIARIWGMYKRLPPYLKDHVTVTKPARGGDPSQEVEFTDGEGRKSTILALPATENAGRSDTATLLILDEFAFQQYARSTWKGAFPTVDGGGTAIVISTANGVHNEQTGEGNFFHFLWVNALTMGIAARFWGVFAHPDRDENWYATNAAALPPTDRAQEYPRTPEEGFLGTGSSHFDLEALNWYRAKWREEKRQIRYRMRITEEPVAYDGALVRAKRDRHAMGEWRIYREPEPGRKYAIWADVATGRGMDFSAAYVIDLHDGAWVAAFHAKVPEEIYATNLYYAGRWYNDALVAVENQGGYGKAVIIYMRSNANGRRPYAKMYRDTKEVDETTKPTERDDYGYPMGQQQRALVISLLEEAIRTKWLPWLDPELDMEARTFGPAKTLPSPRAQDGTNDDRVMAAAGSLDLFRQFGHHPLKRRPKKRANSWRQAMYPWEGR